MVLGPVGRYLSLLVILLCLILTGCQLPKPPQGTIVQVRRVVSGQAIEVLGLGDQATVAQTVRLIGLDAPDLEQTPWGPDAKAYLEKLINQQPILVEFDVQPQDTYQRWLAYLWQGNQLLNEALLKAGYGLAVTRAPNLKYRDRLNHAQSYARVMGHGIWDPRNPLRQTPAEFRRQTRPASPPTVEPE
ncbi:thermonuclease family protein [Trichothermofontia sp.]